MSAIDELAAVREPYAVPAEDPLFDAAMGECDTWHRARNPPYDRLWVDEARPVTPVGLFKVAALDTRVDDDGAWLGSTGTSGGARSRVFFDRTSLARIELAMLQMFLHARFFDLRPARFLLLSPDPRSGDHPGYATAFDRFTACAPIGERVYACGADGALDPERAWAALERWAADEATVFVFGLTVHLERLVLAAARPVRQRGTVKALTGGGWKGLAQNLTRAEMVDRFRALLPAPACEVHDLFGMTEHPLHYLSCAAGRFHLPRYSRALVIGPDGEPAASGQAGLIRLMNPFFASIPSHDLLTEDVGSIAEECACGMPSASLEYIRRVSTPAGTCAAEVALP